MGTLTHVYSLEISLAGCLYDVRINDIPIFRDIIDGFPLTSSMAINEFLTDSINKISFKISAQPGNEMLEKPADSFSIRIMGRPAELPKMANVPLVTLKLYPQSLQGQFLSVEGDGSGLLNLRDSLMITGDGFKSLAVSGEFDLTGANHHWAWQDSEIIESSMTNLESLRGLFSTWMQRLEKRDITWLSPLLTERNRELSLALFEPLSALEAHGLYDAVADRSLTLFDPDLAVSELHVYANGRLAELQRWDGTAITVFVESDQVSARYYPFMFRMGPQGWIICR